MTDPEDRLSAPRQAAMLFAVAGILALVDTVTGVGATGTMLVVGLTDFAIAAMLWTLPWHRWPRRLLTAFVVLTAFPIIGLTYLYAEPHPFIYPIFFLMVFLWIGLAERPGTSLVLSPLTAVAVLLPLHLRDGLIAEEVAGTVALVATCVLVGEVLSRVVRTMRSVQEEYEHRAEALRLEEERRLAAERAREEKQSQLAKAQRIADVGSFDWNLVEDRLEWSDQLFRICGFEPQSFDPTLERFIETLHAEDRERIQAELQAAMAEVRPFAYEYRVVRPNGEVRVCQARGELSTDSDGNVTRVAGTAQDITERKETERLLDYQRNQLAEAQRIADVGSFDWNLVADRLEWSDQLFRICGFEPQSFDPTIDSFIETIHPEDRERIQSQLEAAMGEVRPFSYEYRVVRPNGEVRVCQAHGEVSADVEGNVTRVAGTAQHITERKETERLLEQQRNQLAEAQRVAGIGSFGWDLVEDRMELSDELFRIFGHEPQSFTPTLEWFVQSLHPDDRERVQGRVEAGMREPGPYDYDYRIILPDGEVRVCHARGEIHADEAGVARVMVGTVEDVTERRAIEQALEQRSEQLAEAQRIGGFGSWEWDLVSNELSWSEQLFRIAGLDPAEGITFERSLERVHPDDRAYVQEVTESTLRTHEPFSIDYRLRLPDDSGRHVHARGAVDVGPDGRPRSLRGTLQDVTARKQVEQELVQAKEAAEAANRAKSDFLSSMSHELRTPLNSVIGFANVLGKNKAGNLRDQDLMYLERILANGKHLLELINDVLDLSKVEVGKVDLHIERVSVAALIEETLDELSGAVRDKEIGLETVLPEGPAMTETDAGKLKQILINLVGNAIKFTDEGSVRVELRVDPDSHRPERIDVRDTGPGIPEDRLAAIFEAFEQAETGTARTYGGTGLGLAISAALCDLLGYHLDVESEVGVGSTFSVVFSPEGPAATAVEAGEVGERTSLPAPSRAPAVAPGVETALAGQLVLVIDDETDSRVLLTHHLEEVGCRTISASTGEQGLRMAREFRPSLITLDLLLPGMTGWEILRALKTDPELCDIPVVVVSVVAEDNHRTLVGAVDVIQKPFERDDLLQALRRCLASSSEMRRILIVDDEADSREILSRYLGGEMTEIRTARDGIEALEVLEDFKPDVVVVDVMMPNLDGIALIRKLDRREDCRDIPLVVVTAKDLTREEEETLSRHTEAVLKKGFGLEQELRAALREISSLS